ncbi:MAG: Na/Pi cotransporter family protein [Clostridia bacterium]|nr:Na/Pi cotransporter family protein [Clostridia bacterium]
MTVWDVFTLVGGLCLFMFGMNVMGQALERSAGNKLQTLLGKFTTNKAAGFATGLAVTAVIQSSSATTVMVVGFVNSGLMSLKQAINVIMGANVGTTVTAWVLSLGGIDGDAWYIKMLKPDSFTPILALIGLVMYMFSKSSRKKDIGTILLGFATLMFGMSTMSGAVAGLKEVPQFTNLFAFFTSPELGFFGPLLGVLAGAVLTAIIQSSSASVGILQALAGATGSITAGAAFPIIMGQNIGTCVTALLSSAGANKNGKRTAIVHLSFNIIGTVIMLVIFSIVRGLIPFFNETANEFNIAIMHTIFNVGCTAILLPFSALLEKLACKLVKDGEEEEDKLKLDERLLATPAVALAVCHDATIVMAKDAVDALNRSLNCLVNYSREDAEYIRRIEDKTDNYEDVIGTYLVKLSSHEIGDKASDEAAKLLRLIGDFERISDHAVNVIESAEEMREKGLEFSEDAKAEVAVLTSSVRDILNLALTAYIENNIELAYHIEPLEQVIDNLKEQMRARHIFRLQQGNCSISAGFVWSDILTNLERTSDHCSNIGACVIDTANDLNLHESVREVKRGYAEFQKLYDEFTKKYALPVMVGEIIEK